jgi:hypothetical protein
MIITGHENDLTFDCCLAHELLQAHHTRMNPLQGEFVLKASC